MILVAPEALALDFDGIASREVRELTEAYSAYYRPIWEALREAEKADRERLARLAKGGRP